MKRPMVILDVGDTLTKIVLDPVRAYNLANALIRGSLRATSTGENVWIGLKAAEGEIPEEPT